MHKILMTSLVLMISFTINSPLAAQDPVVVQQSPSSNLNVPSGLKVTCLQGPDTLDNSRTCPVLIWGDYTYWPFSHLDNRNAMTIVAYDSSGKIVNQWYREGARYIWKIGLDDSMTNKLIYPPSNKKFVTFWGQGSSWIEIPLDELRIEPPSILINGPDLTRELHEPVIVIPTDSDAQRPYEMPFVARSTPRTEPPVMY